MNKLKNYEDNVTNERQDDECYVCGEDDGVLLCCDGCPKSAHQECILLRDIPEGDWYCAECVEKAESMRMTRNRLRLTKVKE